MKNRGKVFEENFKKSVPSYAMLYRLPDQAQVYSYSDKIRFTQKNPCDFLLWDSRARRLIWVELKTTLNKSMSFERTPEDKGMIHNHQIAGLEKFSAWEGVTAGFVLEFAANDEPQTVYIEVNDFINFIRRLPKKSFCIADLDEYGVPYYVIGQHLKKKHHKYDVGLWLEYLSEDEERNIDADEDERFKRKLEKQGR